MKHFGLQKSHINCVLVFSFGAVSFIDFPVSIKFVVEVIFTKQRSTDREPTQGVQLCRMHKQYQYLITSVLMNSYFRLKSLVSKAMTASACIDTNTNALAQTGCIGILFILSALFWTFLPVLHNKYVFWCTQSSHIHRRC